MKRKITLITALLILAGLLTACDMFPVATEEPQATLPPVKASTDVIAEGRLVPHKYVTLAFNTGGQVAEVLVEEGEQVQAGQTMAQLNHYEPAEAAISAAEAELLNAQHALNDLTENADVISAEAQQQVAVARDAVRHAEWRLDSLRSGNKQVDIDSAKANVVLLKDELEEAQKDFARYRNKSEDDVQRATFLSKLTDAQRKYDNAVNLLNNLEGTATEIDLAIREAELSLAQARLAFAQQEYDALKDGPDPDDVSRAQARVTAAESRLSAAKAALEDLSLSAPFAGEVVKLNIKDGEQAAPGQPAVVLADFSRWLVETDDLTEMEVPEIHVGQKAQIIPDSLPNLQLQGQVASISNIFEERRGDVLYTVEVALKEHDPRLRWGMTVAVTFENGKSNTQTQP